MPAAALAGHDCEQDGDEIMTPTTTMMMMMMLVAVACAAMI
jgi:hypothetical protein